VPRIDVNPRKAPRQQRSQATVEAVLEAAARVLARDSLAGFNTNRVAAVAGVSVGTVYQYFPNKDALVTALIDRAQAELAAALEAAVHSTHGLPLAAVLRVLAQLAIQQQYTRPVFAAALDHEEKRLPIAARLRASEGRMLASVAQLLGRYSAELAPGLGESAARDCMVITKALVEADAGVARQPPAGLEDRVLRALIGYLTGPGASPVAGKRSKNTPLKT
jgi:AcrR family transcriptional regulator